MIDLDNVCLGCFERKRDMMICSRCGMSGGYDQMPPYLPLKTVLAERYVVGKVIETNGEGATYMGWDIADDTRVAIRELLPTNLCSRHVGSADVFVIEYSDAFDRIKRQFLGLCRSLARMRGLSSMLEIYDIFEENKTAYAVSEYMGNRTLREYLIDTGGTLSWERARALFMPVLSTLGSLHSADIIHKGISPETLLMCDDGKVRLSGFCVAAARMANSDIVPQLFSGYAALEQYGFDDNIGPWTDIYSFAACIYRALVGNTPPEATSRVTNDKLIIPARIAESLPAYVMIAMANALQILAADRTNSVDLFREELSAAPSVTNKVGDTREIKRVQRERRDDIPPPRRRRKPAYNRYGLLSAVLGVVVLLGILIIAYSWFLAPDDVSSQGSGLTTENLSANEETTEPEILTVPSLVGINYKTLTDSENPTSKNFVIKKVDEEYSVSDEGYIISQTPAEGEEAAKGSEIHVVVSKGPEVKSVPYVIGQTWEEAKQTLNEAGFENVERVNAYEGTVQVGIVTKMSPAPYSETDIKMTITLHVNVEPPAEESQPPGEDPQPPAEEPQP